MTTALTLHSIARQFNALSEVSAHLRGAPRGWRRDRSASPAQTRRSDDLQAWWVSTQRCELTASGLPLQLFETHAVPESLTRQVRRVRQGYGGNCVFRQQVRRELSAAETAMLRNIGPIKAAYYAATGAPLPTRMLV